MKKSLTITLALLIGLCAGWWVGRHSTDYPTDRSFRRGHSSLSITGGSGNFPKEAFTMVNFELPQKIDELVHEVARLDHFVVVIPKVSGYQVETFAPSDSPIWKDKINKALSEWIRQRMTDVQNETQEAEQAIAPSRSLPPYLNPASSVRGSED
ncbi:hypothetical protein HZ994_13455 [Akkermansiaceae bacterium]|nr:hypothetical protein HZ994_13455 [Akkermansiaceae bacterium]